MTEPFERTVEALAKRGLDVETIVEELIADPEVGRWVGVDGNRRALVEAEVAHAYPGKLPGAAPSQVPHALASARRNGGLIATTQ